MQSKNTTALALAAGALMTVPAPAAAQDAPAPAFTAELAGHASVRSQMLVAHRRAERRALARQVRRLELRLQRAGGRRAPRRASLAQLAGFERWQLRNRIQRLRRSIRVARRDQVKIPAVLGAIARCESGGNPRAIGGGGRYRGKYQFSFATWASVGGKGDPARASEREQDLRAAKLYARAGASPWPVCGR